MYIVGTCDAFDSLLYSNKTQRILNKLSINIKFNLLNFNKVFGLWIKYYKIGSKLKKFFNCFNNYLKSKISPGVLYENTIYNFKY